MYIKMRGIPYNKYTAVLKVTVITWTCSLPRYTIRHFPWSTMALCILFCN